MTPLRGLAMSWRCITCGSSGALLIDSSKTMEEIDTELMEAHAKTCGNCPRLRLISQWDPS